MLFSLTGSMLWNRGRMESLKRTIDYPSLSVADGLLQQALRLLADENE